MSGPRGIKLSGSQVIAGLLATLTGAIAASYLGVAGTLVGAAVGSMASTMGTEVYKHYLLRSQERLRSAGQVLHRSVNAHSASQSQGSGRARSTASSRQATRQGTARQGTARQDPAYQETVNWNRQPGASPDAASGPGRPVGLGFRAPCLVISPFSRGGYRCSQVFDHTSLLRFLEARFGVPVPNLSSWRRAATGDLTSAPALSQPLVSTVPALPATSLGETSAAEQAVLSALAGNLDVGIPYPLPKCNAMPAQEAAPPRPPVPC
ncbi:MAG TPA: alkaline phosphatase family protein [Streptosporangiaceae bacterium]|nr:alkaline phosphatase family protein [Streptosporangiaceae bacterium]